jgi:hypothetical protein
MNLTWTCKEFSSFVGHPVTRRGPAVKFVVMSGWPQFIQGDFKSLHSSCGSMAGHLCPPETNGRSIFLP